MLTQQEAETSGQIAPGAGLTATVVPEKYLMAAPAFTPTKTILDGWALVPVEPTEAMIEACGLALSKLPPVRQMDMELCGRVQLRRYKALIRYRAMVAAAPKPPVSA